MTLFRGLPEYKNKRMTLFRGLLFRGLLFRGLDTAESADWFNRNQERKREEREERRRKAREAKLTGVPKSELDDSPGRVIIPDIEFIGYEDDLQRELPKRIPVAEKAPAYVSRTSGLPSFAEIVRESERLEELLNPQMPKGWGWQSINDIPTINETADAVMMAPINIMVGFVAGEAVIGAVVVKGTPYVIQGARAAFNFSGDASAATAIGAIRGSQLAWRGAQLTAAQGYLSAGATFTTRYGLRMATIGAVNGFASPPSAPPSFDNVLLIPYEVGEVVGGGARSVWDYATAR